MPSCSSVVQTGIGVFFEYDTPRIVHIRSKKVGIINRFIQLCIIAYVIGYAIVWKKGYQEFGSIQSAVTTKLKGIATVNTTLHPNIQEIWDVADYVVPPQENNAFFVVTNLIVTPNQTIDSCPEDSEVPGARCNSTSDCPAGSSLPTGNGIFTGECSPNGTCEVRAWCPVESGKLKAPNPALLEASKRFTVFIKNNIEFPKFNVKRRNILEFYNDSIFSTCRFSHDDAINKYCPIFELDYIVSSIGESYSDMAAQGGVIQISIEWNCNFDLSEDECLPVYEFRRLDSSQFKISKGYNFRYARYYKEGDREYRTLYKAYGIKFILSVTGQAGKFNLVPLLTNVGSGLALLSIATILCDIAVLYLLKYRHFYKKKKYLDVYGDDAYKV
ncbi:hypothetical protein FSP39_001104 [Pinctada imbricata]|uniref:Purinergic receptor n=1 Tax=Pinctada imbricata TaxID=66713 RepID=A0AA88XM40_PINIB|nr:hypothetical protein FSP39_001104 [Pinctada imbricata]